MKGKKTFRRIINKVFYIVMAGIICTAFVSDSLTVTAEESEEKKAVLAEFIMPSAVTEIDGVKAFDKSFKTGIAVKTNDAVIEKIVMDISCGNDVNEIVVYENFSAQELVYGKICDIHSLQTELNELNREAEDTIIDDQGGDQEDNSGGDTNVGDGGFDAGGSPDDDHGDGGDDAGGGSNDDHGTDVGDSTEISQEYGGDNNESTQSDADNDSANQLTENSTDSTFENADENQIDTTVENANDGSSEQSTENINDNSDRNTDNTNDNNEDDQNYNALKEAMKEEIENELKTYRNVSEEKHVFEDVFQVTDEGRYTLSLKVYYYDYSYDHCATMAENELPEREGELSVTILNSLKEYSIGDSFLLDLTPASITGEFTDKESGYWFNHSREVNVKISGDNIDYGSLKTVKDGKEEKIEMKDNSFTIAFSGDGTHSAQTGIKDLFGRECTYETGEFAIDSTSPDIEVTITDSDKKYTSRTRKAEVLISDANLVGDNRFEYVFKEGEDSFDIKASDAAGNESVYKSPVFIQDFDEPEIEITGVTDKDILNGELNILMKAGDKYFDAGKSYMEIKGKYTEYSASSSFADTKELSFLDVDQMPDDNYELKYHLADLAGNSIEGNLDFTINRNGSTYEISEELKNIIGNTVSEVGEISLTERNLNRILPDKVKLIFSVNSKVIDLIKGKDYFVEEMFENGKYVYRYVFSRSLFDKEGVYTISLSSIDEAGNQNDTRLQKETDGIRFIVEFIRSIFSLSDKEAEAYATENMAEGFQVIGEKLEADVNEYDESADHPDTKGQMFASRNENISTGKALTSDETEIQEETDSIIKEERKRLFNNKVKVALCLALVLSVLVAGERITRNKKKTANLSDKGNKNLFAK